MNPSPDLTKGEFAPYIGRKISFEAPDTREVLGNDGKVKAVEIFRRQGEGRVVLENPSRRQVQIQVGAEPIDFRYEDVTVLAVDGKPVTPGAGPPPVPATRWNPITKTVLNHENGAIDETATNTARAERNLPVPWSAELGAKEIHQPPVP